MKESVVYQEWRQEIEEEVTQKVQKAANQKLEEALQKQQTFILNLLRENIPVETIARTSGLSIAEIKRLAKQRGL